MAQVLVVKEPAWYRSVASLKNLYEKQLEGRVLKYAQDIFEDYYCFQSGYTMSNRGSREETSDPDLILISKNFSEWIIVELELVGKGLKHTKKQLRVFSNPFFDIPDFAKHCAKKVPQLIGKESELEALFTSGSRRVLTIFDTYFKKTIEELKEEFLSVDFCVFEVYRTKQHKVELYRISGNYPFVSTGFTLLKARDYDAFEVEKPAYLKSVVGQDIDVYYFMAKFSAKVSEIRGRMFVTIPGNPFPPEQDLILYITLSNKYVIEPV